MEFDVLEVAKDGRVECVTGARANSAWEVQEMLLQHASQLTLGCTYRIRKAVGA